MPRFKLRTLLILTAVGPPAIACLWFNWRELLIVTAIVAILGIWVWISLSIARFFGWLVASTMG